MSTKMNIRSQVLHQSGTSVVLSNCMKFSCTNTSDIGSGKIANVYVNGSLTWVLPEHSSTGSTDSVGYYYDQVISVEFRDASGSEVQAGNLLVVQFVPGNEVQPDIVQ